MDIFPDDFYQLLFNDINLSVENNKIDINFLLRIIEEKDINELNYFNSNSQLNIEYSYLSENFYYIDLIKKVIERSSNEFISAFFQNDIYRDWLKKFEASGDSLILYSFLNSGLDCLDEIIQAGASVDLIDYSNGYTPLIWAAKNSHSELFNFLINKNASHGVFCNEGKLALDYLIENNNI